MKKVTFAAGGPYRDAGGFVPQTDPHREARAMPTAREYPRDPLAGIVEALEAALGRQLAGTLRVAQDERAYGILAFYKAGKAEARIAIPIGYDEWYSVEVARRVRALVEFVESNAG